MLLRASKYLLSPALLLSPSLRTVISIVDRLCSLPFIFFFLGYGWVKLQCILCQHRKSYVWSLPLCCLDWSAWELHISCFCDTAQYFTWYIQFEWNNHIFFHPTKTPSLLILSAKAWISCSHFAHRFLMGTDSQILRFLLELSFYRQTKGQLLPGDPEMKGPSLCSSPAQAVISRSGFTHDIFCNCVTSCCQLKMSQESSCYWLRTARIKQNHSHDV